MNALHPAGIHHVPTAHRLLILAIVAGAATLLLFSPTSVAEQGGVQADVAVAAGRADNEVTLIFTIKPMPGKPYTCRVPVVTPPQPPKASDSLLPCFLPQHRFVWEDIRREFSEHPSTFIPAVVLTPQREPPSSPHQAPKQAASTVNAATTGRLPSKPRDPLALSQPEAVTPKAVASAGGLPGTVQIFGKAVRQPRPVKTAMPDPQGLPPEITALYDAANQLTQFNSQTPNVTYDENGNLTSITTPQGTTQFVYDARNRLVEVHGPGLDASFKYDALGRRISRTVNGETAEFLYDGHDIVAEIKGGAVIATYLRNPGQLDEPFIRISLMGNEHYHANAQGSILALTDGAGNVKTRYDYDAFGNTTMTGTPSSNLFQYTGRENDGTGLYYYRARYYSPMLRRFLSEDPIEFLGGDINLFSYTQNNPINLTDPGGLLILQGSIPSGCEPPLDKREKYIGRLVRGFTCSLNFLPAVGGVNITGRALKHIVERHVPGGTGTAGKSLFGQGENIADLVRKAESVAPIAQPNGKFERIINAGRTIGTDVTTGQPTSTYTVITNDAGELVTAFPGKPHGRP